MRILKNAVMHLVKLQLQLLTYSRVSNCHLFFKRTPKYHEEEEAFNIGMTRSIAQFAITKRS